MTGHARSHLAEQEQAAARAAMRPLVEAMGKIGWRTRLLAIGERLVCLAAADDWLNAQETDESAHKSKAWLRQPPTEKQLAHLPPAARAVFGMSRYQASARLAFEFNRGAIRRLVMAADAAGLERAA